MVDGPNNKETNKPKTLSGFLASALDMEEEISNSVYRDYMNPDTWPAELEPEIFQNIRQYLSILIKDTQKHRKIILAIIEQYGQDK